jgi:hypothetical protein
VFVSPLLNLAPANGTGPTVAHSGQVLELSNGRIAGTARLTLSPDRRTIEVSVALDPPMEAEIRLRRLDLPGGERPLCREEGLLVVEIAARGRPRAGPSTSRRFSLDRRQAYAAFADADALLKTGICLSQLRAGAISGMAVEPMDGARRGGQGQREYLCERMLGEISAAEGSATPAAASRHVELATLYARRLGAGIPALAT